MRYKRGIKVEVLTQKDVPSGSWRSAEIISGNGHTYAVRYDAHVGSTDEAVVERVSRKSIRPFPPPKEFSENWVPGDIVEVFDNFSWKMATISKVLDRKFYLVRLLGSVWEFKVKKVYIRARLSWQDDKWVVIGKGSRNFQDGKQTKKSTPKYSKSSQVQLIEAVMNPRAKGDCVSVKNKMYAQEMQTVYMRTLKRRMPDYDSPIEPYAGAAQKFRVTERDGRRLRVIAAYPTSLPEKVDAVASTREMLAEKQKNASFNNRTGFSEMDVERLKPNGAVGSSFAISLELNDADSVTCSVGSCSTSSNIPYELPSHSFMGPEEDIDGNFSDAESFCRWGNEEGEFFLPTEEELAAEIHRLELHAYHCTMVALHALGPLSWEQETLVTNLRLSLHISNDEHLMELRNLGCTDSSIPIR
ncbi:uncharacterized protein LOC131157822 [Malania oleifera]|uniref:uncharacterized protein LOC131157822 n=1 Tax=Malania oleifera TaxID=397392 RepID=UPI0025AE6B5D|nr:uncharacterized protein LOC131157822 [Malania oleifera]XP_057968205.1 uncharacterized protein LOC131157822 [Malania oleifera]